MKIEPLGSGALKIWMSEEELERWGLNFESLGTDKVRTQRALIKLLGIAKQRLLVCPEEEMRVEIVALQSGYLFLITPEKNGWSPVCKPKIYAIANAEELLRLGETLAANGFKDLPLSSLYEWDKEYRLIVYGTYQKQSNESRILTEFAQCIGEGDGAAAFLEEHGIPIIQGTALHRLCAAYESRLPTPPHPAH